MKFTVAAATAMALAIATTTASATAVVISQKVSRKTAAGELQESIAP